MANRMPFQPGDNGMPAAAQGFYYAQNGAPNQPFYVNYPPNFVQLQALNPHMQYQTMLELQRRQQQQQAAQQQQQAQQAAAAMRGRAGQQMPPGQSQLPPQQQQQQQPPRSQEPQRYPGGPAQPPPNANATPAAVEPDVVNFDLREELTKQARREFCESGGRSCKLLNLLEAHETWAADLRAQHRLQQQQQRAKENPADGLAPRSAPVEQPDDNFDVIEAMHHQGMTEFIESSGRSRKLLNQLEGYQEWSNDVLTQHQLRLQHQQQQQRLKDAAAAGGAAPPIGYAAAAGGKPGTPMQQDATYDPHTGLKKDALPVFLHPQGRGRVAEPPRVGGPGQQPPPPQLQQQRAAMLAAAGVTPEAMMAMNGNPQVGPRFDQAIATASPPVSGGNNMLPGMGGVVPGMMGMNPAAVSAAPARGRIEVEDDYGLKPLVKVLQAAPPMTPAPHVPSADEPTDPATGRPVSQQDADEINFSFITRGFDITQLGLSVSQQEWLHPTLATLPLDTHHYFILPEFKIPDSYKKPRPRSLSMKSFNQFKEETLFYIFYSMPRDVLHLAAARALYERGWRYHKRDQHWFHPVKLENGSLMETVTTEPDGQKIFTGTYNVFHPNEWKEGRTADNYVVNGADVEEQSVLVAAMEEAARQQAQRSRAKAAAATTPVSGSPAGGNEGAGIPTSASPAANA